MRITDAYFFGVSMIKKGYFSKGEITLWSISALLGKRKLPYARDNAYRSDVADLQR